MSSKKTIKITELFDAYPVFYQPYIPPVINKLKTIAEFDVSVVVFNGKKNAHTTILPSYYKRKVLEKIIKLFKTNQAGLNFEEMMFLQNKTDIVHIQHSYLFPKILGLLHLKPSKRPKIIITLRGGDTYVKPWIDEKWSNFYKKFGNYVDAFVVMSEHQKLYLQNKWNIEKNRIHIIPISFGETFMAIPKTPKQNEIAIISVFRMCWEKNISGNLLVVKELLQRGLPVHYQLYGDGPDSGQVHYLIDAYELSKAVTYYGKVENSEVKKSMAHSDFMLQLSHSEAFPTSILEAQSMGLPAIVSRAGGLPEAISINKSGYCTEAYNYKSAADYIENLWKNPERYEAFSKAAIETAHSNFSVACETDKLIKLYKSII